MPQAIPKWSDISASQRFLSLPEEERETLRNGYFLDFVAPALAPEQISSAHEEWDSLTKPKPPVGAVQAAGRGLTHGAMGLAESVGTGLQFVGNRVGSEGIADLGESTAQYWKEKAKPYEPPKEIQGSIVDNPELLAKGSWWTYNLFDTIPSLAASIIPGVGAAKAIKIGGEAIALSAPVVQRLAIAGGTITGGAAGGSLEGAQTYREVLERGGSEAEAAAAGSTMALASAALNAISVGKVLTPGKAGALRRFLTSGATEALTEWAEEPTEGAILSATSVARPEDSPAQRGREGLNVAPIAFVLGGGAGALSRPQRTPPPGQDATIESAPPLPIEETVSKVLAPETTVDDAIQTAGEHLDRTLASLPADAAQVEGLPEIVPTKETAAPTAMQLALEDAAQRKQPTATPLTPKTVAGTPVDAHTDEQLQELAASPETPAITRHAAVTALQARTAPPVVPDAALPTPEQPAIPSQPVQTADAPTVAPQDSVKQARLQSAVTDIGIYGKIMRDESISDNERTIATAKYNNAYGVLEKLFREKQEQNVVDLDLERKIKLDIDSYINKIDLDRANGVRNGNENAGVQKTQANPNDRRGGEAGLYRTEVQTGPAGRTIQGGGGVQPAPAGDVVNTRESARRAGDGIASSNLGGVAAQPSDWLHANENQRGDAGTASGVNGGNPQRNAGITNASPISASSQNASTDSLRSALAQPLATPAVIKGSPTETGAIPPAAQNVGQNRKDHPLYPFVAALTNRRSPVEQLRQPKLDKALGDAIKAGAKVMAGGKVSPDVFTVYAKLLAGDEVSANALTEIARLLKVDKTAAKVDKAAPANIKQDRAKTQPVAEKATTVAETATVETVPQNVPSKPLKSEGKRGNVAGGMSAPDSGRIVPEIGNVQPIEQSNIPKVGTNPEQRPTPRVAESQAPAVSDSGDAGVAPGREGGVPNSEATQKPAAAESNPVAAAVTALQGAVNDLAKAIAPKEGGTPSAISSGATGTPQGGTQERAVRADKSGSPELAQTKGAAGGSQDTAIKDKAVQAALKAANKEKARQAKFDVEEELQSMGQTGNGAADLSELAKNPEYWDAENEEFTPAGFAEADWLNRLLAEDRVGYKPASNMDELNSADQTVQAEAFDAYADGLGLHTQTSYSSGGSRYVEVSVGDEFYKFRFADHFNTVRDTTMQPDFNVAPGRNDFTEAIDYLDDLAKAVSETKTPADLVQKSPESSTQDGQTDEKVNQSAAEQPEGQRVVDPRSFLELSRLSDEVQNRIDAMHDELDKRGVPFDEQNKMPEVVALYDERIKYDTAAAQKGYIGSRAIIEKVLAGMPRKTAYASVDSMLRERYSLTSNPQSGVYMMSKYTGKALDSPKTVDDLAKDISVLIVARDYPNADYHLLMGSNMSALTSKGKAAILQEAREKAVKINEGLRSFFLDAEPAKNLLAATPPTQPTPSRPAAETGGEVQQEPIARPEELNFQRAMDAHRGTSMVPAWASYKRAHTVQQEFADDVNGLYDGLLSNAQTDEQKAVLRAEVERYKQGYLTHMYALLGAQSRTMSAMIAGPSNFPVTRNQKRMDTVDRRREEFLEWRKKARQAVARAVSGSRSGEQVADDAWTALKKDIDRNIATVKGIDDGSQFYTRSAFTNSISGKLQRIADGGDVELVRRALDYIRERQAEMKKPFFAERNSVWSLGEKAQEAAAREAPKGTETVAEYEGASIVNNNDEQRVQILFDTIPGPDLRNSLKAAGWRWSPSNKAWQRQNTDAAIASAKQIVGAAFDVKPDTGTTMFSRAHELPDRRQSDTGGTQRTARVDRRQDLSGRIDRSLELMRQAESDAKDLAAKLSAARDQGKDTTELTRQWKDAREAIGRHRHDATVLRESLESHRSALQLSQSQPGPGLPAAEIRAHLAKAIDALNIPVKVYENVEAARADGITLPNNARGFAANGRVGLIASNIRDALDAEFGLFHEIQHVGVREFAKSKDAGDAYIAYRKALTKVAAANPDVRRRATEWRAKYGKAKMEQFMKLGLEGEALTDAVRIQSWDEAIADIAGERGGKPVKFLNELIAALQRLVRALGFDGIAEWMEQKTDAEVLSLIRQATQAVTKDGAFVGTTVPAYSQIDQTETPAFKAWFGDSVVTDTGKPGGEPLLVYHGAVTQDYGGIEVFLPNSHFGSREQASDAQRSVRARKGSNTRNKPVLTSTVPVYLSIQNPMRSRDVGTNWGPVIAKAIRLGHDGIVYKNTFEGNGEEDSYIIFKSTQVKSAIGNNGEWNPLNSGIAFSLADGGAAESAPDWVRSQPADMQETLRKAGAWRPKQTLQERAVSWTEDWQKKLRQGMVDQFDPIKSLDYHAYMLARMSKSAAGPLESTLLDGAVFIDKDGAVDVNYEKGGFIGRMQNLKGEHDRFFAWVIGNRAGRLMAEGREHNFSKDDIQRLKTLNQGKMEDGKSREAVYLQAMLDLNRYNKSIVNMAEKAGLIDGESRPFWEKDFYIPFYRMTEGDTTKGPVRSGGLVRQYAFKTLKGGEQAIGDPMENILKNWAHLIDASLKNQAAVASLDAAVKVGVAHETTADEKGAVFVMKNGVKTYYAVDDPFVLDAINSLGFSGFSGPAMKVMSTFKRWLTYGVTISPTFRIRNVIRDSVSMIGTNPASYNVLGNVLTGWKLTKADSPAYASMIAGGGVIRFGTFLEGDSAAHTKRLVDAGVDAGTILDSPAKVKAMLRVAYDWWMHVGDRSENVNRAALYQKLRDEGRSHLEASYAARDTMDFSMMGTWSAIRFLAQTVPFFNARLQGMYKLGRGAAEDPRRFSYVIGGAALASMALLLAYKDDDDWKQREDFDRETFWWFKIDDKAFRIPKPFEIGAIGTLAERGLEAMITDDLTGKQFAKRMGSVVGQQLSMNPVPQLFMPMIETWANRSAFTGRAIESMGMDKLSKSERIATNTSAFAQLLGKNGVVSPVQIDHLINGYFGWLGTHAVATADLALRPGMGLPDKPAMRVDEMFVLGDFVRDMPAYQSKYVTRLYDQGKEVQEAMADMRAAQKIGATEKAAEILKDKGDKIRLYRLYTHTEKQLTQINQQIKMVQRREGDADFKRSRLDQLYERRNRIARITEEKAQATQR